MSTYKLAGGPVSPAISRVWARWMQRGLGQRVSAKLDYREPSLGWRTDKKRPVFFSPSQPVKPACQEESTAAPLAGQQNSPLRFPHPRSARAICGFAPASGGGCLSGITVPQAQTRAAAYQAAAERTAGLPGGSDYSYSLKAGFPGMAPPLGYWKAGGGM